MVKAGKRGPQGRPSGAKLEGPVLPWQPPNTLGQSTKKRKAMQEQHGIVSGPIELAPALPGQGEGTKAASQFEI
jgi:hypothetical protein